jgi:hypothetical protein
MGSIEGPTDRELGGEMKQRPLSVLAFLIALLVLMLSLIVVAQAGQSPGLDNIPAIPHDWQIETIDNVTAHGTSLRLDSEDKPHATYFRAYKLGDYTYADLMYANKKGTTWVTETITASVGFDTGFPDTSLAIDSLDQPHIAFHVHNPDFDSYIGGDLVYAHREGDAWHVETVERGQLQAPVGTMASLALDKDDRPYISHITWDHPNNISSLNFARHDGSTWITETITLGVS